MDFSRVIDVKKIPQNNHPEILTSIMNGRLKETSHETDMPYDVVFPVSFIVVEPFLRYY